MNLLSSIVEKLTEFDNHLRVTSTYARRLFPKRLVNSTTCLAARKKLMSTVEERFRIP